MFPNFTLSGPDTMGIAVVVGLVLAFVWILQFANLMSLGDSVFPGQFVRLGWVAAFVTLWFIAPFAFMLWNQGRIRDAQRRRAALDPAERYVETSSARG